MRKLFGCVNLFAVLTLVAPYQVVAASGISTIDETEKTVPQGMDPPGADNGLEQPSYPPNHKDVITPPPIGDKDIYTEVPNPEAGHDEEVIPPPDISR